MRLSPDFSSALGGSHPCPVAAPAGHSPFNKQGHTFHSRGLPIIPKGSTPQRLSRLCGRGKGARRCPKTLLPSTAIYRARSLGLERSADSGPDFDHRSALLLARDRRPASPVPPLRAGQCGYRVAPGCETNPAPPPFPQPTPSVVANFVCCLSVGFPGSEANGTLGMVVHTGG